MASLLQMFCCNPKVTKKSFSGGSRYTQRGDPWVLEPPFWTIIAFEWGHMVGTPFCPGLGTNIFRMVGSAPVCMLEIIPNKCKIILNYVEMFYYIQSRVSYISLFYFVNDCLSSGMFRETQKYRARLCVRPSCLVSIAEGGTVTYSC